jgi:hydrogenase expression/formation protein HypE
MAATLNEIAAQSEVGIELDEAAIPIRREVKSACELLGLDPLYVANEGKMIVICPSERAEAVLAAMRAHPKGQEAAVIGRVLDDPRGFVRMRTGLGGTRMVDWLAGEQMPRIC